MPYNIAGVTGGLIGVVEGEVEEQFGSYTNLTAQVNQLKPIYFLGTANNTASTNGTLTYTVAFNELTGDLNYSAGVFTKASTGSNYYLFTPNFTWANGATTYVATVKYTPSGGAATDFYLHSRVFTSAIGTSFATGFSFVIKLAQGDTVYITSAVNYGAHAAGYSMVTKLG